jgi:nucleoside 2-deoxyribosyltransferase
MDKPSDTPTRPRIYLAGPDVFRPDARDHFVRLKVACDALGLAALLPADGEEEPSPDALEKRIYEANMQRLRGADGVVANLSCFRGTEPDSGTVFEVGAAVALGIPVVAYGVPEGSYADRARATLSCTHDANGVLRESATGIAVEDFGQPLNLMLACSICIEASPEAALQKMAEVLAALRQGPASVGRRLQRPLRTRRFDPPSQVIGEPRTAARRDPRRAAARTRRTSSTGW